MMHKVQKLYNTLEKFPMGKTIFSKLVCLNAPYFGSIKPRYQEFRPGYGRISMKKRRSVTNHIKSVHAIAMANLCELVAGSTLEITLPADMRWIPSGMDIQYLKIARTNLEALVEIDAAQLTGKKTITLEIPVTDINGEEVVHASIRMHISPK